MPNFIGLDIGSSSIKGAALDLDRICVGPSIRTPSPEPISGLPPLHFELDPHAVVASTRDVLHKLLAEIDDCTGVVSCCQMQGVVLVDSHGQALTNYLSWRDQRALEQHAAGGGSYFDHLQARLSSDVLSQLGHECKQGSAPSLLFWLAELGRLPGGAIPLTLGDYVWLQLCDGTETKTEYTNALGAMQLGTGHWHHEAFDRLGINGLQWPTLGDYRAPVGRLSHNGAAIPCYPSVGDHQCALAGTMLEGDELSINVSTGSQVSMLTTTDRAGEHQLRPYFDGQFLKTITHLPAGRSLNVLVGLLSELAHAQNLELSDPWSYISAVAAEAESELAVDLAFFAGPMGESGRIDHINVNNLNVGSLFRSAFLNMADNYELCARRLASNHNWRRLVLSGGLVQNCEVLRQLIQSRFDCDHRLCVSTEETLQGLLVLSLVVSGHAEDVSGAIGMASRLVGG